LSYRYVLRCCAATTASACAVFHPQGCPLGKESGRSHPPAARCSGLSLAHGGSPSGSSGLSHTPPLRSPREASGRPHPPPLAGPWGLQGYPLHSPKGTPGGIQGYPLLSAGEATLMGTPVQGYPLPGQYPHGGLEGLFQGYPLHFPPFTPPVGRCRCYHLVGVGGVVELRLLLLHLIPPAIPCDVLICIHSANAAIICEL
jgi:hypothetical protein